jgi:hypothetical protein
MYNRDDWERFYEELAVDYWDDTEPISAPKAVLFDAYEKWDTDEMRVLAAIDAGNEQWRGEAWSADDMKRIIEGFVEDTYEPIEHRDGFWVIKNPVSHVRHIFRQLPAE